MSSSEKDFDCTLISYCIFSYRLEKENLNQNKWQYMGCLISGHENVNKHILYGSLFKPHSIFEDKEKFNPFDFSLNMSKCWFNRRLIATTVRCTVNNKKTHTPCFSTLSFFAYKPLQLQKIHLHLFILVLEELSA